MIGRPSPTIESWNCVTKSQSHAAASRGLRAAVFRARMYGAATTTAFLSLPEQNHSLVLLSPWNKVHARPGAGGRQGQARGASQGAGPGRGRRAGRSLFATAASSSGHALAAHAATLHDRN